MHLMSFKQCQPNIKSKYKINWLYQLMDKINKGIQMKKNFKIIAKIGVNQQICTKHLNNLIQIIAPTAHLSYLSIKIIKIKRTIV